MPLLDGDDAGAEPGVRRHVGVGGQGEQRVAPDAVGDPEALVAEPVRPARAGHRGNDGGARVQEDRGSGHVASYAPTATPTAVSCPRRSSPLSTRWSTARVPTARAAPTVRVQAP